MAMLPTLRPHRSQTRGLLALGAVCLALVALVACFRPVKISEVHARSQVLMGKPVIVEGRVVRALDLPLLHDHFYELDDGTGQIWVQSAQPTPTEGSTVRVTGTLGPGIKIAGNQAGLLIVEQRRK